ncbi:ATPase, T2SS/T4P/T4SS family, partial [Escherichia coli]|uniref:ATPase, T2SS/T4P/T4SS family n=1 Tax=Escherichia coli TaxID=562 RepID=UPI003F75856F
LNQFDVPFPQLRELVRCILVQDLVRTVCPHCHNHPDRKIGCKVCGGIGYNGQTIISECEYFPYPESLDPFIKRVRDGEDHR